MFMEQINLIYGGDNSDIDQNSKVQGQKGADGTNQWHQYHNHIKTGKRRKKCFQINK
jgi:hypothetical protein